MSGKVKEVRVNAREMRAIGMVNAALQQLAELGAFGPIDPNLKLRDATVRTAAATADKRRTQVVGNVIDIGTVMGTHLIENPEDEIPQVFHLIMPGPPTTRMWGFDVTGDELNITLTLQPRR